jgi:hypothetical protein
MRTFARYGNGRGEHGGVHGASNSNPSAVARELAGLAMIKRRRSLWHGSREPTAQLGGQDKSRTVRPGRTAKECWQISAEAQCALSGRNVRSRETPAKSRFAAHCAKGSPDRSYDRKRVGAARLFDSALAGHIGFLRERGDIRWEQSTSRTKVDRHGGRFTSMRGAAAASIAPNTVGSMH